MAKTITLRLDNDVYEKIKKAASSERRSISNYIENATLDHLEECAFVDTEEMAEITSNNMIVSRLKRGAKEAKQKKGNLIE